MQTGFNIHTYRPLSWVRSEAHQAEAIVVHREPTTGFKTVLLKRYGTDPKQYKIELRVPPVANIFELGVMHSESDVIDLRCHSVTKCTVSPLSPKETEENPGNFFSWLKEAQCGVNRYDENPFQVWEKDDVSNYFC